MDKNCNELVEKYILYENPLYVFSFPISLLVGIIFFGLSQAYDWSKNSYINQILIPIAAILLTMVLIDIISRLMISKKEKQSLVNKCNVFKSKKNNIEDFESDDSVENFESDSDDGVENFESDSDDGIEHFENDSENDSENASQYSENSENSQYSENSENSQYSENSENSQTTKSDETYINSKNDDPYDDDDVDKQSYDQNDKPYLDGNSEPYENIDEDFVPSEMSDYSSMKNYNKEMQKTMKKKIDINNKNFSTEVPMDPLTSLSLSPL